MLERRAGIEDVSKPCAGEIPMKKLLLIATALLASNAMAWSTGTGVVTSIYKFYNAKTVGTGYVYLSNYVGGSTINGIILVGSASSPCSGGGVAGGLGSDQLALIADAQTSLTTGAKLKVSDNAREFCGGATGNTGYMQSGDSFNYTLSK